MLMTADRPCLAAVALLHNPLAQDGCGRAWCVARLPPQVMSYIKGSAEAMEAGGEPQPEAVPGGGAVRRSSLAAASSAS